MKTLLSRGYLYLIFVQILFGTMPMAGKYALRGLAPDQLILLRICGATLFFLLLTWGWKKRLLPQRLRDLPILLVCGLIGITLNQLLFFRGLELSTSVNASLIQVMIPIFTFLIAILSRQERFHWSAVISLLLAASGVLTLFSERGFDLSAATMRGNLYFVCNTLAYASYLVLARKTLQQVDPLRMLLWVFGFGMFGMVLYFFMVPPADSFPSISHPAYVWLLYIILFPTVIVYLLNLLSLQRLPTTTVGLFIYIQPLVATILGSTFLGERLTVQFWIALVLIFTGLAVSQRRAC